MDLQTSFGRWLRQRRRALDLTQQDLARQVGCAIITIQKLEADERRPSRQLAERLADKLMVAPDDRAALISLARAEPYRDSAPAEPLSHQLPAPQQPPTNLPAPLTRLIGRKQDLAAVRNALLRSETRLLTLIGPPGIGKTRLSIAAAMRYRRPSPMAHTSSRWRHSPTPRWCCRHSRRRWGSGRSLASCCSRRSRRPSTASGSCWYWITSNIFWMQHQT